MNLLILLLVISVSLQFIVSTAKDLSADIDKLLAASEPLVLSAVQKVPSLQEAGVQEFSDPKIPEGVRPIIADVRNQLAEVYANIDKLTFKTEAFCYLTYLDLGEPELHRNAIFIDPNLRELQNGINAYFRLRQRIDLRLQKGNVVVGIISSSILPILLGALGACAYIVRLISQQIQENTFSKTSPTRHLVRLALGTLSGVVVGYGGLANNISVSPAALAFIAGYAVEPVFATLDNIAEKFRRVS